MKIRPIFLIVLFTGFSLLLCTENAKADDITLAKEFYAHNLRSRALEIFIELLNKPQAPAANKAEALYYMGQISFDEGRYSTALNDWQRLIKNHPTSPKATEVDTHGLTPVALLKNLTSTALCRSFLEIRHSA